MPSKQPSAHRLQTRWQNKSNRKTSAPSGARGPSVIAVIPGSFYPPLPVFFFPLHSLALILLLKVTAGNTETLQAQVHSFFLDDGTKLVFSQPGSSCVISVSSSSSSSLPPALVLSLHYFHSYSLTNWPRSYCVPGVRDAFKCALSFIFYFHFFSFFFHDNSELVLFETPEVRRNVFSARWKERGQRGIKYQKSGFVSPQSKSPKAARGSTAWQQLRTKQQSDVCWDSPNADWANVKLPSAQTPQDFVVCFRYFHFSWQTGRCCRGESFCPPSTFLWPRLSVSFTTS